MPAGHVKISNFYNYVHVLSKMCVYSRGMNSSVLDNKSLASMNNMIKVTASPGGSFVPLILTMKIALASIAYLYDIISSL